MAYSDFRLDNVLETFDLQLVERSQLFRQVAPHAPSPFLTQQLQENVDLAVAINTEKARSELIIVPVLLELRRQFQETLGLFSGIDFTVDTALGLNGYCDFLLSATPNQLLLSAPVVAIVEAKNENLKAGLPQCMAEMVAAQRFNQQKGNQIPAVYGAVTIGTIWQFMKLEGQVVTVDLQEFYIREIDLILGVLALPFIELSV